MKSRYTSRIAELIKSILSELPIGTQADETRFVEQFYAKVPMTELEATADEYATELAQDAYKFFIHRAPGTPSIRVFAPQKSIHGYDRKHVVVQLINDDKPFLVDSLTAELNALGFTLFATYHPIFTVVRDETGKLQQLLPEGERQAGDKRESFIHFEISALPEGLNERALEEALRHILDFVGLAVSDWQNIVVKMKEARGALKQAKPFNTETIEEAEAFLDWLATKNFVFLGYVAISFTDGASGTHAAFDKASFLGISKIDDIPAEINTTPLLVDVRKANRQSLVHRRVLMDVITVKRFNIDGRVIGEHRFYGLFTSTAYFQSANTIPLVGKKISRLIARAGFDPSSHNGKALNAIIQFMPRDELFQINDDDLFELSMGILALESRPGVKLFARLDVARRYISALVYVPRELFSTGVRKQVIATLENHFHAHQEHFNTEIGESPLARLHMVLRTSANTPEHLDIAAIEKEIATTIMLWTDKLKSVLLAQFGEQVAERLFRRYANAFEDAYTVRYAIASTLFDIRKMEDALKHQNVELELYHQHGEAPNTLHLKIYNVEQDIALSDILPKLEYMGLRVIDEFPFVVTPSDRKSLRIRDIRMQLLNMETVSLAQIKPNFEELMTRVWHGEVENDRFNALVFLAGLHVRQIEILRAYSKYLRQIGFAYSTEAISKALRTHRELALLLVQLFETRFDVNDADRQTKAALISSKIEQGLSQVTSLQEDTIIATLHKLILATLRTNYFVRVGGHPKPILSFKLNSAEVPNLPLPRPYAEIFVYSARVEGIHLRGGKVARGGIRWSDRHEDFRTEVLGLMKAQMVKNAVIVPVGSKGGFVVKQISPLEREAYRVEGVECYKLYLQGLLDVTDNISHGKVVPPAQVVRYDEDDPYLVVAADKGTASFSDTANAISKAYGFWLDDAFASGGSAGYDHKEMGITARGGWVSVERHFREMGVDIHTTPFTTVGIGDMSGDVFGNGMLLSRNIKLVAAFNHLHIFLDPNPEPEKSFVERERLFHLPRSSWSDYHPALLSEGGGVFERSAKSIVLSSAAQQALGTTVAQCSPDELIRLILKAPVDLLWNGGIGTYVKAETETHDMVGDRANNTVRINGKELRAKIVGEGGNLGFTQQGRIEYAKGGGRINTDAIDNSGGVDCSDHEVNIKIALQGAVATGKLTLEGRNQLLTSMTEEVASLVLRDNTLQTQAISVEQQHASARLAPHAQLIRTLEARGLLNRAIEFLPNDAELEELRERGQGLTRPQLAVLMAYSKIALFGDIVASTLPDENYFASDLLRYFPQAMKERFDAEIKSHSLKREIIGTVATNSMVNRAGISFYFDIAEDTKLPARDIVTAYTLARDIFKLRTLWDSIEALGSKISASDHGRMYANASALLKQLTFWLLRHKKLPLDIEQITAEFEEAVHTVMETLPDMLIGVQRGLWQQQVRAQPHGLGDALAAQVAMLPYLVSAPDICRIALTSNRSVVEVGKVYFALAEQLQLYELLTKSEGIHTPNRWDRLALQSLLQEFYDEVARLTDLVYRNFEGRLEGWMTAHESSLKRMQAVGADMLAKDQLTTPMVMVLLRQLKQVAI